MKGLVEKGMGCGRRRAWGVVEKGMGCGRRRAWGVIEKGVGCGRRRAWGVVEKGCGVEVRGRGVLEGRVGLSSQKGLVAGEGERGLWQRKGCV